jgi:hypothetical protein
MVCSYCGFQREAIWAVLRMASCRSAIGVNTPHRTGPAGDDGEEAFEGVDPAGQCSGEKAKPAQVIYLALHNVGVSMGGVVVRRWDRCSYLGKSPSAALKKF